MDKPNELISSILDLAVNAPSGHNCQPWRFIIRDGVLENWNIPEKDKTLFNHEQKGSLIAHGALLENVQIISSKKGYETLIDLFPKKEEPNLIARIQFKPKKKDYMHQSLYDFIESRSTNRKPFKKEPLNDNDKAQLSRFISNDNELKKWVIITEDRNEISEAARILSTGDRVLFDNYFLHSALFSVVNWSLDEEQRQREGLYIETKELSAPVKFIFKHFIRQWRMLRLFSFLDLPSKMAHKREDLYIHSSAIGVVTCKSATSIEMVESGRLLQRLWLKATSLGISFQPVSSGLLYLGQWLRNESPQKLTVSQRGYVTTAYSEFLELFKLSASTPVFTFRLGYADAPTATSLKKPPNIQFI